MRTRPFQFASICITNKNTLATVGNIYHTAIVVHHKVTVHNIHPSIVKLHRGWPNVAHAVCTLVYGCITGRDTTVNIIAHALQHAVISCFGVEVVSGYLALLVCKCISNNRIVSHVTKDLQRVIWFAVKVCFVAVKC